MAVGLKEFDFGPCLKLAEADVPLTLQREVINQLRGAFSNRELTGDPVKLARFESALKMATDVCLGERTLEEFDDYRDLWLAHPDYEAFLHKAGILPGNYWFALRSIATHSFTSFLVKRRV